MLNYFINATLFMLFSLIERSHFTLFKIQTNSEGVESDFPQNIQAGVTYSAYYSISFAIAHLTPSLPCGTLLFSLFVIK